MKKYCIQLSVFLFTILIPFGILAQTEVLFSVDDLEVTTEEFKYVFEKNNSTKATETDIKEYLRLYKNFKLKVKAALDQQMDTLPHLKEELNTYRRQLSKNYLLDKQLQENVARETFERQQYEIKLAHIVLIAESEEQEKVAREKLVQIKENAENEFAALAAQYSDDPGTKENGGVIGYLSAPFAKGFEKVEDLAYQLDTGQVGGPVNSDMGVHLIKVLDRRPALGRIQLSHIFVRKPKPNSPNQERERDRKIEKIEQAHESLEAGTSFKHATLKYSEDDKTKYNDGYLGYIEPNTYEEHIEEAVFALEEHGDYTQPIESSLGWHIYMRGDRIRPQDRSYEDVRAEILSELKYTHRLDIAQASLIEQIKDEAPFKETSKWIKEFRSNLPTNFTRYDWETPQFQDIDTLFQFGTSLYKTRNDFIQYLKRNTRERLRLDRKMKSKDAFDKMYENFITESAIEFEENQLEEKYPEFRHLMREYREGILLFEITKDNVWDKAPQDTAGLKRFYTQNKEKYRWNDRARLLEFKLASSSSKACDQATKHLMRRGLSKTIGLMNKDSVQLTYTSSLLEKGKTDKSLSWQENVLFDVKKNNDGCTFNWIQEIIPSQVKTLEEARGYVISDYQNELEEKWINHLQNKYDIRTYKRELKSLIRSYK